MPTPVEFMTRYRNLKVSVPIDDPVSRVCRTDTAVVRLRKYFLMKWKEGTEERSDYDVVTGGSATNQWFRTNRERIRTAAMGKGAPEDYELALEWAVRSNKLRTGTQAALQAYCDAHLGIDCSGFATNYLIACGKKAYSKETLRNTSASSYFNAINAINDPTEVRQGHLLVWFDGNQPKNNPGHVAVVQSFAPQSMRGGNMRVVEATGASGAIPKLLDSSYRVEQILPKGGPRPAMILVVRRFNVSGHRVAVVRA